MASASKPVETAASEVRAPARGLVRFSEALMPEVLAFQREAFPARRAAWVEPRWRWMFQASARRVGVEPMMWLYRSNGRIVAQQGGMAVVLHTPVGEFVTGWFVETMALEEVRGKAIGPMVVAKALQDLPFNLSLGQTEQMRELQYRLGWKRVAPLQTLAFVLNGRALVVGKIPAIIGPIAGAALNLNQRLRYWRGRSAASPFVQVREVSRFTAAHDELWKRAASYFPVAVVRDAAYLNWKYVDQPGQSFLKLELRDGCNVRAVVVINLTEPDGVYNYRRGWLNDIVLPLDDVRLIWTTFEAVRQTCIRAGADLILFDIINDTLVRSALAFGFMSREPARFLLIAPGESAELAALVLEPANWLVTRGDSDLDRPW